MPTGAQQHNIAAQCTKCSPAKPTLSCRPLERVAPRADRGPRRFGGEREGGYGGREGYRREGGFGRGAAPGGEDKAGAPSTYQPKFGGFGRGAAPPS